MKVEMLPPLSGKGTEIQAFKATSGKDPATCGMCGAAGGIHAEGTEE